MLNLDRLNLAGRVLTRAVLCMGVVSLTACVLDKKLGVDLSDSQTTSVTPPVESTAQSLSVFAGLVYNAGHEDGVGAAASFNSPSIMAVDGAGNAYVADTGNHTIRKITPAGVVTTLAGTAGEPGSTDGTGAAARFNTPYGVAVDAQGNVYVADTGNAVIRKITSAGEVTTLAGTLGVEGGADGTGAAASFHFPVGLVADATGNVYVADNYGGIIRKITPAGEVTTLAGTYTGTGSTDGTGPAAQFNGIIGLALDSLGNLYVADSGNNTIRKITPAGEVTTLAGTAGITGSADGTGAAASFNQPRAVATDSADNVYVTDTNNHTIRKITPAGEVTTLAGATEQSGGSDGQGSAARFFAPFGIAVNQSTGQVLVGDSVNNAIRQITASGAVSTLAGVTRAGSADGVGTAARFKNPLGAAADASGNVFVVDYGNDTIRKITPAGEVSTLAGTAGVAGSADGTGAAASFTGPGGVATDASGNVYVADTENNVIRKITPAGVVTTLAGTAGVTGSADDTGAAAGFNNPGATAVDSSGNVYVTDAGNHVIRKITPAGEVTTLAGTAGVSGSSDGTGAAASFAAPSGIAIDGNGNLYVADAGNHTIRKVTPAGVVTTLAGSADAAGSDDGAGTAALFDSPQGVALDSAGNLYVADTGNHTIRKITSAGVVSTIAGVAGQPGFSVGTLPGLLSYPIGVALSGNSLYITSGDGVVVLTLP